MSQWQDPQSNRQVHNSQYYYNDMSNGASMSFTPDHNYNQFNHMNYQQAPNHYPKYQQSPYFHQQQQYTSPQSHSQPSQRPHYQTQYGFNNHAVNSNEELPPKPPSRWHPGDEGQLKASPPIYKEGSLKGYLANNGDHNTPSRYNFRPDLNHRNSMNSYRNINSSRSTSDHSNSIRVSPKNIAMFSSTSQLSSPFTESFPQHQYQQRSLPSRSELSITSSSASPIYPRLPPVSLQTFYETSSHSKVYVIRDSLDKLINLSHEFREVSNVESVHVCKSMGDFVLFIKFLSQPDENTRSYHQMLRYTECKDLYVKEPNSVYIPKGKNKSSVSSKRIHKLFKILFGGDPQISKDSKFYKVKGDEIFIRGVIYKYGSHYKIEDGKIIIYFDLEGEIAMNVVEDDEDSSSDSDVTPEPLKRNASPLRPTASRQRSRMTSMLFNSQKPTPRRERQRSQKSAKPVTHEILSDDDDGIDSHVFSLPKDDEELENLKNFDDNDDDDDEIDEIFNETKSKTGAPGTLTNKELIKQIDDTNNDEDIIVSHSPFPRQDHTSSKEPESQVISDDEEDADPIVSSQPALERLSTPIQQTRPPSSTLNISKPISLKKISLRRGAKDYLSLSSSSSKRPSVEAESQVISSDDEEETQHNKRKKKDLDGDYNLSEEDAGSKTEKDSFHDATDDVQLSFGDVKDAKFQKMNRKLSKKDLDSKFIMIRYIPNVSEKKIHEFIQDLLELLYPSKLKVAYVNSSEHEAYLEFITEEGILESIKKVHNAVYENSLLSVVLLNDHYASQKIEASDFKFNIEPSSKR